LTVSFSFLAIPAEKWEIYRVERSIKCSGPEVTLDHAACFGIRLATTRFAGKCRLPVRQPVRMVFTAPINRVTALFGDDSVKKFRYWLEWFFLSVFARLIPMIPLAVSESSRRLCWKHLLSGRTAQPGGGIGKS
jgi:hypothetical protein